MLLDYAKLNLHTIAFRTKSDLEANKSNPGTVCPVREISLLPGINEVDDNLWKSAKEANSVAINMLLLRGTIKELPGDKTKRTDMAELIARCVDEKLLRKMKATDPRQDVQEAIAAQMKKLEDAVKPGGQSENAAEA